jgi:hypothetical protein
MKRARIIAGIKGVRSANLTFKSLSRFAKL